jgi:hypothetical protein
MFSPPLHYDRKAQNWGILYEFLCDLLQRLIGFEPLLTRALLDDCFRFFLMEEFRFPLTMLCKLTTIDEQRSSQHIGCSNYGNKPRKVTKPKYPEATARRL